MNRHWSWQSFATAVCLRRLTLDSDPLNVSVRWQAGPGYEESLSKAINSIMGIANRKQAERAIRQHVARLETLYESGLALGRLLSLGETAISIDTMPLIAGL